MYGYHYGKRRDLRRIIAGEFPSAILREECRRFLAQMAYYAWCMVEGLCVLSNFACKAGQESCEEDQEESRIFGQ